MCYEHGVVFRLRCCGVGVWKCDCVRPIARVQLVFDARKLAGPHRFGWMPILIEQHEVFELSLGVLTLSFFGIKHGVLVGWFQCGRLLFWDHMLRDLGAGKGKTNAPAAHCQLRC